MFLTVLAFILCAGAGAFLRFSAVQWIVHPWGTFTVNLIGSLLIGFLAVYLSKYTPVTKSVILVAFLGSLTTFSSYSLEIITFMEEGMLGKALLYFLASNILCFLACFSGWKIAQNMVFKV